MSGADSARDGDPELRRCRRYGCRHEARDHGVIDGKLTCWRCPVSRREHGFTVRDGEDRVNGR